MWLITRIGPSTRTFLQSLYMIRKLSPKASHCAWNQYTLMRCISPMKIKWQIVILVFGWTVFILTAKKSRLSKYSMLYWRHMNILNLQQLSLLLSFHGQIVCMTYIIIQMYLRACFYTVVLPCRCSLLLYIMHVVPAMKSAIVSIHVYTSRICSKLSIFIAF